MTKEEFLETVKTVMKEAEIESSLLKLAAKAYDSGALPTVSMKANDHTWAKIVIYSALDTVRWNVRPLTKESNDLVKTLKHII